MIDRAYFTSPAGQAYTLEVGKLIIYMASGIFFYDLINNVPFDWAILSGKKQRRLPQLAYFTARIALLIYISLLLQILWAKKPFACQMTFYVVELLMGIIVWTSSILLACRTICVYTGATRDIVATTLSLLALGLLAAWMQGVLSVTADWLPEYAQSWNEGACVWTAVSDTYFVKYICTIVFDAIVLIFTIVGIIRMNGKSRLGYVLIRQGIVYFILTLVANSAITVLTLLQLSPTMSLMLAVPQSVICVLSASRLYVQLANEAKPRNETSRFSASDAIAQDSYARPMSCNVQSFTSQSTFAQKPHLDRDSSLAWGRLYTLNHDSPRNRDINIEAKGSASSYFAASHYADSMIRASDRTVQGHVAVALPFVESDAEKHVGGGSSVTRSEPRPISHDEERFPSPNVLDGISIHQESVNDGRGS